MNKQSRPRTIKKSEYKINDKMFSLMEQLEEQTVNLDLVETIAVLFEDAVKISYDVENMHRLEDLLSTRFIDDIATGKLNSMNEIKQIAIAIDSINQKMYLKWYS